MNADEHPLISRHVAQLPSRVAAAPDRADELFAAAARVYARAATKDPDVERALAERDTAKIAAIAEDWDRDRRVRPLEDRELLKRALKVFRKRLKFTRLDDESRLGVGAMTKGGSSGIYGMSPPSEFPREVFEELARQGRLREVGHGIYGLVDEAQ
jgi:hypothetical protein